MKWTLRYGVLAVAVLAGFGVADLSGGILWWKSPPKKARATGPAWLNPPEPVVHRTCYPDTLRPEPDPRPLVWVVDGAGDLRGCSNAMTEANLLAGTPVELSAVAWSHGYGKLLLDQIDGSHARAQGERLAARILERRMREPGRRVVLVAHSAGCAVALAAGNVLPPDAVDRTILLAPSVSTGYDVRSNLWAAREGVDVFCSRKDWVALGFVTRVVGTVDRFNAPAAGRHGFHPKGPAALNETEESRLRQHFWSAEQAWTGHHGGHHGMYSPTFIQAYLFPLIGAVGPAASAG